MNEGRRLVLLKKSLRFLPGPEASTGIELLAGVRKCGASRCGSVRSIQSLACAKKGNHSQALLRHLRSASREVANTKW